MTVYVPFRFFSDGRGRNRSIISTFVAFKF